MNDQVDVADVPALPAGARLVHIGPPKTGTTTLQAAFDRGRDALRAQGVLYAGRRRHSREAAIAATETGPNDGEGSRRGKREWQAIVRDVRSARDARVFFSSERLSHARPEVIRRIVEELGGDQVQIALTLRPIWRILPSQWQQSVQSGLVTAMDDWHRNVLSSGSEDPRSIWYRHRHDRLVERWADVVGSERITVVVADDRDPTMLLRAFERLLDLHPGTLQLHRDLSNRSMTLPEIEAVRALNVELKAIGFPGEVYRRLVEMGASFRVRLRDPDPGDAPIELPAWAAAPLEPIARDIVAGIARSGVRVIGDLERLAAIPLAVTSPSVGRKCITPAAAAALSAGLLATRGYMGGTGAGRSRGAGGRATGLVTAADLDQVPVRRLGGVLVRRLGQRAALRSRVLRTMIARR